MRCIFNQDNQDGQVCTYSTGGGDVLWHIRTRTPVFPPPFLSAGKHWKSNGLWRCSKWIRVEGLALWISGISWKVCSTNETTWESACVRETAFRAQHADQNDSLSHVNEQLFRPLKVHRTEISEQCGCVFTKQTRLELWSVPCLFQSRASAGRERLAQAEIKH